LAGALNGNERQEVTWRWSGADGRTGTVEILEDDGSTIRGNLNGLANGVDQTVEIWGVSPTGSEGPRTRSDNVMRPVGPLLPCASTITRTEESVTITWDWTNSLNGNPADEFTFGFNIHGLPGAGEPHGRVETSIPGFNIAFGTGYGQEFYGVEALTGWMTYYFDDDGASGNFYGMGYTQGELVLEQACGDTQIIPPSSMFQDATITVSRGSNSSTVTDLNSWPIIECSEEVPCYSLDVVLTGFRPSTWIIVSCFNSDGAFESGPTRIDSRGSATITDWCFIGPQANYPWTGPYWAQADTQTSDGTFDSNKDVSW